MLGVITNRPVCAHFLELLMQPPRLGRGCCSTTFIKRPKRIRRIGGAVLDGSNVPQPRPRMSLPGCICERVTVRRLSDVVWYGTGSATSIAAADLRRS